MHRKFIVLLSVFLIVATCVIPAFAADLDYNDYIYNIEVDDDLDIVSVSIPVSTFSKITWRVWDRSVSGQPVVADTTGQSFTYAYNPSHQYLVNVNPFAGDYLDLSDIPDQTTIIFSYSVEGLAYAGDSGIRAAVTVNYYDANHGSLSYVNGPQQNGQFLEVNQVAYTISKPSGAAYARFGMNFVDLSVLGNSASTAELESVTFQFSISSLTRLQQETGRTNKLLDQIMNGYDPEPTPPSVQDSVDDMHDAEDEVIENFQPDRVYDDLDDMTVTILDQLVLFANAFGLITLMFNAFLAIPELGLLAYISLCIGLLAALLGIAFSFVSKGGSS